MIKALCGLEKQTKTGKPFTLRGVYLHIFLCESCKNWLQNHNPARHWRQEAKAWLKDLKDGERESRRDSNTTTNRIGVLKV